MYTSRYDRTVIRGDSDRFKVTFKKRTIVNGKEYFEPIDITDWNVFFTVRKDVPATEIRDDNDAIIKIDAVITNAEEGIAVVYVKAEDTTKIEPGTYYYDIQYIRPADEFGNHQVRSIRKAKYVILGDITRRGNYTVDGGNAFDFKNTEEVEIVDPCDGYNGGHAVNTDYLGRVLDAGNAKSEIPQIEFKKYTPTFFDGVKEDADDGYEI